jgi:hypothetical protein
MAFHIKWRELDSTAADALRMLINYQLLKISDKIKQIEILQLTELEFGATTPMVELVHIGPSELAVQADFEARSDHDEFYPPRFDTGDSAVLEDDYVGAFLGSDGISISLRLKHGGGLSLAGHIRFAQGIQLTPSCSIGAAMPVNFAVRDINIDTLVVVDIYRSTVRIWLEPAEGADMPPITRMDVSITFGASDQVASPVVGEMIVAELQELLMSTLCSPQCLEFGLGHEPAAPVPAASAGISPTRSSNADARYPSNEV